MRYLVVLTALLVVLTALLASCPLDERPGKFQMAVTRGSTVHEDRVWVLNTATGAVSLCYETAGAIGCIDGHPVPQK